MKKSMIVTGVVCLLVGCAIGYAVAMSTAQTQQTTALEPPANYTGLWEVKDSSGRVIEIKTYANGQLHGPYIKWYNNGPLHWVYNFSVGEPKGRQVTFDKQGEILDSSVK